MSKKQANLVCLIVAAIWGGGFIATDAALQTFDPFTVLMIRFMGASLVSIVVCFCSHVKVSKQALFRGSISGGVNVFGIRISNFWLGHDKYGSKCIFDSCQCCACSIYCMAFMEKEAK